MKTDAISFWRRVDLLMDRSRETIGDLSSKSGIPYNTIITQRTRRTIPKIEQLVEMSIALGTTIDFLVTGNNPEDEISRELKQNPPAKFLAQRILFCSPPQLHALGVILDSWNIEVPLGKSLGRGTMIV